MRRDQRSLPICRFYAIRRDAYASKTMNGHAVSRRVTRPHLKWGCPLMVWTPARWDRCPAGRMSICRASIGNAAPGFREQAARLVIETGRPVAHVAAEIGVGEQALGCCVRLQRQPPQLAILPGCSMPMNSRSSSGCAERRITFGPRVLDKGAPRTRRWHEVGRAAERRAGPRPSTRCPRVGVSSSCGANPGHAPCLQLLDALARSADATTDQQGTGGRMPATSAPSRQLRLGQHGLLANTAAPLPVAAEQRGARRRPLHFVAYNKCPRRGGAAGHYHCGGSSSVGGPVCVDHFTGNPATSGDLMAACACPFTDGSAFLTDCRCAVRTAAASVGAGGPPTRVHPGLQIGAHFLGIHLDFS